MQGTDHESASLTPQESWGAIHSTMEEARSSMYLAGTATILLLWGVHSIAGVHLAVRRRDPGVGLCDAQPLD